MTRRTLTLVGAPLALALLLAACGGSSGTTPAGTAAGGAPTQAPAVTDAGGGTDPTAATDGGASAAPLPACADLLSDAEAAAVLGRTSKPVNDQSNPYGVYCSWDIGDGYALSINATVDPASVGLWRGTKDSVPTADLGKETAPPSGLGDESYAFNANAGTYYVFVRRGDQALYVHFPTAPSEQTVRDLVDKLFSRL